MTTPEATAVPWILILAEPDADPIKTAIDLLDHGAWQVVEGGWMVTPSHDAREKAAARARRYRRKQRGDPSRSRDADRHAGVTQTSPEFDRAGGEYPPSMGPMGPGWMVDSRQASRERDADASRAVTRDGATRDGVTAGAESWRMDPLTEEEREAAQAKIREMGAALRSRREEGA